MRTYSKRCGRRPSRRQKRQRGGQVMTIDDRMFGYIDGAITGLAEIHPGKISYFIARDYSNIMMNLEKLPVWRQIDDLNAIVTAKLEQNRPPEFAAFSNICRIDSAIVIIALSKYINDTTEPIDHDGMVITRLLQIGMDKVFEIIKTYTPARINQEGPSALTFFENLQQNTPAEIFNNAMTILSQSEVQIYWLLNRFLTYNRVIEITNYPVWPAILMSEFPVVNYTQPPTFLYYLKTICINTLVQSVISNLTISSQQQPITTTQPPSPIPNAIIRWLTTNIATTPRRLRPYLRGAIRFITNAFPNAPQIPGNLSVPASISIHGAIVSWLREQMNVVPQEYRSNLKAAYFYIQRAFPTETTASQVEAAKNKLTFGP